MLTLAALLGAPSGAAGQEIPDSAIVTVIARGLQTVWALAEAPDGRLVVTEHGGLVRTIVEGEFAHEPRDIVQGRLARSRKFAVTP